jgi:hypothetical protein
MDAMCRQGSCPGVEDGLTGGVHLLVGEGEAEGTSSGEAGTGRGRKLAWAGSVSPGLLSLFFLFFFSFLFSFLSFAILIQIRSNHFQKFSKILSNVLSQ